MLATVLVCTNFNLYRRINFMDMLPEKRPGVQLQQCPLEEEATTPGIGPTTGEYIVPFELFICTFARTFL